MSAGVAMGFLIAILAVALLLLAIVSAGTRSKRKPARRGGARNSGPRLSADQIAERWATIEAMAAGGGNGLRTAVSEADKLLDLALRQSGARGDTMGERLKSSGKRFSNLNAIWRAHKLRNALAHEVGFDLVPSQAKEALADFKQGLRDLGALS